MKQEKILGDEDDSEGENSSIFTESERFMLTQIA